MKKKHLIGAAALMTIALAACSQGQTTVQETTAAQETAAATEAPSAAETAAVTEAETEAETAAETEAAETEAVEADGDETEAEASGDAASYTTIKEGKLMVGLEIGYPPLEYFDEDGATPIGFDVELATAIADQMGLELELVDTAWDGIFAGVDTDKYDVIMSSVSWTEGRNENYNLSKTYVANAPAPTEIHITAGTITQLRIPLVLSFCLRDTFAT